MNKKITALLAITALSIGLTACGDKTEEAAPAQPQQPVVIASEEEPTPEVTVTPLTPSQQNAVDKAEVYLELTGFSRDGLVEQLLFEKFEPADAEFAVDYISVDWNEQAAIKAKAYQELTAMSRQGMIDQLIFDKFTQEQAEFGATSLGL